MVIAKFQNLFYFKKANSPIGHLNVWVMEKTRARKFPNEEELWRELSNNKENVCKKHVVVEKINEN